MTQRLVGAEGRTQEKETGDGLKGRAVMGESQTGKLALTTPYRILEDRYPQVAALKGMDQCSPFHSLTADRHTEEVLVNLMQEPAFSALPDGEKGWAVLAARLHDIGKGHPEGRQEKDGRMTYINHDKISAKLAKDMLPDFDISERGTQYVLMVIEHHMKAIKLIDPFGKNDQPKGKQLASYERFLSDISQMPGSETKDGLIGNLRFMVAFARADVRATVSDQTEGERPELAQRRDKDVEVLSRLERALPAIIEALEQKQSGVQQAGIAKEEERYVYRNYGKVEKAAYDMKALSEDLRALPIPPVALGIIKKTAENGLQEALGEAGLGEHAEIIMALAEKHRLR